MHAPAITLGRLRKQVRAVPARELAREVLRAYSRNDLLTSGSAIAFQVLFALIPVTLCVLGLLGFFGLQEVWTREVVPGLRGSVSAPAFELIDTTVRKVLGSGQGFWVTAGILFAVWEMSGAVRGIMGSFDRIYGCTRRRSFKERYLVSIGLAVVGGALLLAATATFMLGPTASGVLTVLRWPVCVALLLAAIAAFVRWAPADPQPMAWVSFGSLLVIVAWLGTSVAFAFYVRNVADYGNIFGALATVFVTLEYFYLASVAFLTGAQLDAIVRERAQD